MQPPSATTIIPGSSATQLILVMNPAKVCLPICVYIVVYLKLIWKIK